MDKLKVFICIDHYLPGYKSGGPVISIANMVEAIGDQFQFYILTHNYDWTEASPYTNVVTNRWSTVGKAQVYYASNNRLSLAAIRNLIMAINPDILYLNIFFSRLTMRFLLLRYLHLIPNTPTILAPMGTFSPGAMNLKAWKKRPYVQFVSVVGLYNNLIWRASSDQEKHEIQTQWKSVLNIRVTPPLIKIAPDINNQPLNTAVALTSPIKNRGSVKFVFVSRISRKKNLDQAVEFLRHLSGKVEFGIYGSIEDQKYWDECCKLIDTLPDNIVVKYYGLISHDDVPHTLLQYHFFLLPTLGENYGHAIIEAMDVGLPVIISDTTPWHDLSSDQAGWDIPLSDHEAWQRILQTCVEMGQVRYSQMSANVKIYLLQHLSMNDMVKANIDLLQAVYRLK